MTGLRKADAITTVAEHLSAKIYKMANIVAEVMPSGLDEVRNRPAHYKGQIWVGGP